MLSYKTLTKTDCLGLVLVLLDFEDKQFTLRLQVEIDLCPSHQPKFRFCSLYRRNANEMAEKYQARLDP